MRFVMKMAKGGKETEDKITPLVEQCAQLKKENETLKKNIKEMKKMMTNLESRIDKHVATYNKDKKGSAREVAGSKKE